MKNDELDENSITIRVVIADDEYKVCQLICQLIDWEALNMKLVGTASNGIEALKIVEEENPDLALTDIRMPGYDGMELLRRARKINPDMEFIVISGYSHFEYAQAAIQCGVCDYILKPINRDLLNTTLQKVRQRCLEKRSLRIQVKQKAADVARLRKTFWNDMVLERSPKKIEEINQKYHYHFENGIFQSFMILADVQGDSGIDQIYESHVFELMPLKTLVYLQNYVQPFCLELETFCQNEKIYGIINYLPEKKEKIREEFKNFIHSLRLDLSAFEYLRFHLSTSNPFDTIEDLLKAYHQCERAMGQRLLTEEDSFFEKVPADAEYDEDTILKNFGQKIQQGLDLQRKDQIKDAVLELESMAMERGLNGCQIFALAQKAYHLFLLTSIVFSDLHFKDREKLENEFNSKAFLCGSEKQLFLFLTESCQKDLEDACQWIDQEKIKPISQAKQYIREHYSEALNLDHVSSQVGFSPSYFSTMFRKETGKTFVEYLTDVRIEEAKKLLRESRITIELICNMVGSNDSKRFSKTFKRETGISPKEYRNLYS